MQQANNNMVNTIFQVLKGFYALTNEFSSKMFQCSNINNVHISKTIALSNGRWVFLQQGF